MNFKCLECDGEIDSRLISEAVEIESREKFSIGKCSSCGILKTIPVPESLDPFYPVSYRNFSQLSSKILKMLYRLSFLSLGLGTGSIKRVTEIGCGPVLFLEQFYRRGWKCLGVEKDITFVKDLSERHPEITFTTYDDFIDSTSKLNGLTLLWHSLEHLERPLETLDVLSRRSERGSRLVIAVPNIDSLQLKIFKRHWIHLDPPRHLSHFSPRNLENQLIGRGYKILSVRTFFPALEFYGVAGSFAKYVNSLGLKLPMSILQSGNIFSFCFLFLLLALLALIYLPVFSLSIVTNRGSCFCIEAERS